jgi:hypothetical protein
MEPERRIEKWLRAFAKKRREQAGDSMELRPATRQRLQREIARRAEEKNRSWFAGLFFGLRPALAFAVCFIALAVIGWILLPNFNRPQPASLSMAKLSEPKTTPAETAPAPTPPPASVAAPVVVQEKKALADKQMETPTAATPAPPVIVAANREPIVAPESGKEVDRAAITFANNNSSLATKTDSLLSATNAMYAFKNENTSDSLAVGGELNNKDATSVLPALKPQSTALTGSAQTLAANDEARQKTVAQSASVPSGAATAAFFDNTKNTLAATPPPASQFFNRLETPATRRALAGAPSPPTAVLVSFRVEQNGNDMKVVDADGSIYLGSVQFAQQTNAVTAANAPKNAPSTVTITDSHALLPATQNYSFRVAGTNQNLKQNVIFSGNFVPLTNSQFGLRGNGFGGGGGAGGGRRPANPTPAGTLLSNSRITGTAVIGNQKAIEVNATPAP